MKNSFIKDRLSINFWACMVNANFSEQNSLWGAWGMKETFKGDGCEQVKDETLTVSFALFCPRPWRYWCYSFPENPAEASLPLLQLLKHTKYTWSDKRLDWLQLSELCFWTYSYYEIKMDNFFKFFFTKCSNVYYKYFICVHHCLKK